MNLPLTPIRCLLRAAQEYGSKIGIVDGDQRSTWSEVWDRTRRIAAALSELGINEGERVASLSFNCRQLIELYYAAPTARAVLLSLNVRLSAEEQAFILRHSGTKLVFFEPEFLPLIEGLRRELPELRWVSLVEGDDLPSWVEPRDYEQLIAESEPLDVDFTQYDENQIAELFYTSGSTGRPKGVMQSHRTLYLHALGVVMGQRRRACTIAADEAVEAHTIPLFHANGWGRAHTITMMGGRHVMLRRFDPEQLCETIEQESVTSFSMVPAMAAALLSFPKLREYDLSSLDEVNIGGAASSPSLVRRLEESLGCNVFTGYGLTESGPVSTMADLKQTLGPLSDATRYARQAMTGWAMPGTELRVVDPEGIDLPQDGESIGEALLRGDAVMDGYWAEPEATAEAMEGSWLHTGDMAVWDEDRYLLIVDRKKDIIISGGENISSLEIEKVLAAHPAVYEAAVIGIPDEKWGETPKAIVSLKEGHSAGAEELKAHVREHLAGFKVPSSVEFRDELPKGATGKILKRVLREPYWEGRLKKVQGDAFEG